MKTITMYELLGLVKDGKAPRKIKYENSIYVLNDNKAWADEVYSLAGNSNVLLNFKHIKSLNDEVEIIEENKIPEELDLYDEGINILKQNEYVDARNSIHKSIISLECKYNQLLNYLKSKGE